MNENLVILLKPSRTRVGAQRYMRVRLVLVSLLIAFALINDAESAASVRKFQLTDFTSWNSHDFMQRV